MGQSSTIELINLEIRWGGAPRRDSTSSSGSNYSVVKNRLNQKQYRFSLWPWFWTFVFVRPFPCDHFLKMEV